VKYLDEYRDPKIARVLVEQIRARVTRHWVLMEICGGHTHTLMRYGIDDLLAPGVELVHGPGCPVCVTALETIDKALAIASRPDVTLRFLWRHAAGSRLALRPVPRQGVGWRCAHRLFADGCAEAGAGHAPTQGGVFRRRV
jgi:hypothetical protein